MRSSGLGMDEKKLNIIKKVYGVHGWVVREDKNRFPCSVFVFDKDGNHIMEYNEKIKYLYCRYKKIWLKTRLVFNYGEEEVSGLIIPMIEEYFGWKINAILGVDEHEHIWRNIFTLEENDE